MAKSYEPQQIRNVGFYGHRGSGKTSLGEALLFTGGVTTRLGSVEAKTSILDCSEEEQKRGMSIITSLGSLEWRKHKVNMIVTPGDQNFLTDARNSLHVVETAMLVVSALDGVEVGTEKLWAEAKAGDVCRMFAVTKCDRERAKPLKVLDELVETFGDVAALQLPIGEADKFEGVVDLVSMKAYMYPNDGSGKPNVTDIPADLEGAANDLREKLVEKVAEVDDELTEKYLEELELSDEDFKAGLAKAMRTGSFAPVLFTSGTANIGVAPLLDFLIAYGATPLDRKPLVGRPESEDEDPPTREASPDAPFSSLVFKSLTTKTGKLSLMRVYSGTLSTNSEVYNVNRTQSERVGGIFQLSGRDQSPLEQAVTGDIVAVPKLKVTETGDSLSAPKERISYDLIQPPVPLISYAIKGVGADDDKIVQALTRIREEDSALVLDRDEWFKEILLRGQGQIHIEVVLEKLRNQFKLEVELKPPSVAYRETLRGTARNIEGKLKKQTGGRGQFAVCYIDMEPSQPGDGFEFENGIVGGVIPKQYIPAVEKGVREASERGPLAGYPTVDFKVRLHDGKTHDVDSSEHAFKAAGTLAFRNAVQHCRPVLLEPFLTLEVTVPTDLQGTINGDLNSRRGRLEGTEYSGKNVTIMAKVPQAEVLTYANQLNSMTEGRGTFSMDFSHYEQAPQPIQERIIALAAEKKA